MTSPARTRQVGVRLADVLSPVLEPAADVFATSGAISVDRVQPGDVYFAPDEDATTVGRLATRAVEAGAKAVVAGQLIPPVGAPLIVVDDPRAAFGSFCHALMGSPCEEVSTTAVAGAYGKSSVVRLLDSIHRHAGRQVAVADGAQFSDSAQIRRVTGGPPTAAAVAGWLGRACANGCVDAITEAPSAANSDGRFDGARFRSVCVTNLERAAAGRDGSIKQTRADLTWPVAQLDMAGYLVVNANDQSCCRLLGDWNGAALTFGLSGAADVTGRILERHTAGQVMTLRYGAQTIAIETKTVGDAHATNCLAAAATALAAGVPLVDIAAGIEAAPPASLVMQPVVCGQAFPVYLDAASAPASVRAAVRSVASVANRRVLTIVDPAGNPRQSCANSIVSAAKADSDVLFVPHPATDAHRDETVRYVEDRFTAIALALALADPGDAVLVLGCGEDSAEMHGSEEHTVRQLLQLRLDNEQEAAAVA